MTRGRTLWACTRCGAATSNTSRRCDAHPARISTQAPRASKRQVRASALICALCGLPARHNDELVADHRVPRDEGGGDGVENLRALHRSCNAQLAAVQINERIMER